MKNWKKKFLIIFVIFIICSILLKILGFDFLGIAGVFVVILFGIGSLAAGLIGICKPSGKTSILGSVLLVIYSPFAVWVGYNMTAAAFYNPIFSFFNNPTKTIVNPGSLSTWGFFGLSLGVLVLYGVLSKSIKTPKQTAIILVVSSVVFIVLGGHSLFADFAKPSLSADRVPVENMFIATTGLYRSFIIVYRIRININGENKDFDVSKQIYNIFNPGDKVSITYKLDSLETITLTK